MPTWKRAIDLAFCLAALPLLALAIAFTALLQLLASPGPVFFVQERIGYRGRPFRIYKFRTMHAGSDTAVHQAYFAQLMRSQAPMVKLDSRGDPRLMRGAWLLRASGFDELPQLLNVLRGDMSLVGPRPCLPAEYAEYLPGQKLRFESAPGLTGLWQVSGKNRTTFEEMIRLDIEYARRRSPWLDAAIIIRTIPAAARQIQDTRRARRALAQNSSPSLSGFNDRAPAAKPAINEINVESTL